MMSSRLRLEAQTLAALQRMSAIQHEPSAPVSEDTAMETKDWTPTPSERHQTYMSKLECSIRGHACDALDSWLYNNHVTVDRLCAMMKTSKNVGSRFGSVTIGNGVFAFIPFARMRRRDRPWRRLPAPRAGTGQDQRRAAGFG